MSPIKPRDRCFDLQHGFYVAQLCEMAHSEVGRELRVVRLHYFLGGGLLISLSTVCPPFQGHQYPPVFNSNHTGYPAKDKEVESTAGCTVTVWTSKPRKRLH